MRIDMTAPIADFKLGLFYNDFPSVDDIDAWLLGIAHAAARQIINFLFLDVFAVDFFDSNWEVEEGEKCFFISQTFPRIAVILQPYTVISVAQGPTRYNQVISSILM